MLEDTDKVKTDKVKSNTRSGWKAVDYQLKLWMNEVIKGGEVCIDRGKIDLPWQKYWGGSEGHEIKIVTGPVEGFCEADRLWVVRFCKYIASMVVDQAEAFLSKYGERFVTLPKMPKQMNGNSGGTASQNQEFSFELSDGRKQELVIGREGVGGEHTRIFYVRHGETILEKIDDKYYEALSGSQSTLSSFVAVRDNLANVKSKDVHCRIAGFVTQLVENASSRVLIIDERVVRFMKEHAEVGNMLAGLRIAVADDSSSGVRQMFSSDRLGEGLDFSGVGLDQFEIVIIHQGIIDKLLHGHEDKEIVKIWLDKMVRKLHYVIITTGRGLPSNIPDAARVLPYSVIQNSILQRFPEKMLLVDAVMNILPIRKGI